MAGPEKPSGALTTGEIVCTISKVFALEKFEHLFRLPTLHRHRGPPGETGAYQLCDHLGSRRVVNGVWWTLHIHRGFIVPN